MKVTKWKFLLHDQDEHAYYYERAVYRDDGKIVVQVASKGDGIDYRGKVNNAPLSIHHQFFRKDDITVRPITREEKARAVAMRGRGMGVEPSSVVVSLSEQHGFVASLSGDVDGGLGTVEGL